MSSTDTHVLDATPLGKKYSWIISNGPARDVAMNRMKLCVSFAREHRERQSDQQIG